MKGTFELRMVIFQYEYGYVDFIHDRAEDEFYNRVLHTLIPWAKGMFIPKPYDGDRW